MTAPDTAELPDLIQTAVLAFCHDDPVRLERQVGYFATAVASADTEAGRACALKIGLALEKRLAELRPLLPGMERYP